MASATFSMPGAIGAFRLHAEGTRALSPRRRAFLGLALCRGLCRLAANFTEVAASAPECAGALASTRCIFWLRPLFMPGAIWAFRLHAEGTQECTGALASTPCILRSRLVQGGPPSGGEVRGSCRECTGVHGRSRLDAVHILASATFYAWCYRGVSPARGGLPGVHGRSRLDISTHLQQFRSPLQVPLGVSTRQWNDDA